MKKVIPFDPGSCIKTKQLTRKVSPVKGRIKVKFPGRVHITLLDSNRFDFGVPGAGGMGFALHMDNQIHISLSDKDFLSGPQDILPILAHMTYVMKKVLKYKQGISVYFNADKFFQPHKGLGYTTTISTSCAQGINLLFGSPLTEEEIQKLISYNYSEARGGRLIRGTETGVGPHLVLKGGFVIVGGDLKVIYSREFLPSYYVALIDPGSVQVAHKEAEYVPVMDRIQKEDQAFRYHKAYLILMDLIPALYSDSIETIGDIIWRFQFGGNNLFETEKYPDMGKRIFEVMHEVRFCCEPKPIVGLSSVGPIIYAITKNIDIIRVICESLNVELLVTKIDNQGLSVLEE